MNTTQHNPTQPNPTQPKTRQGKARQGKAKQDKARQGKTRHTQTQRRQEPATRRLPTNSNPPPPHPNRQTHKRHGNKQKAHLTQTTRERQTRQYDDASYCSLSHVILDYSMLTDNMIWFVFCSCVVTAQTRRICCTAPMMNEVLWGSPTWCSNVGEPYHLAAQSHTRNYCCVCCCNFYFFNSWPKTIKSGCYFCWRVVTPLQQSCSKTRHCWTYSKYCGCCCLMSSQFEEEIFPNLTGQLFLKRETLNWFPGSSLPNENIAASFPGAVDIREDSQSSRLCIHNGEASFFRSSLSSRSESAMLSAESYSECLRGKACLHQLFEIHPYLHCENFSSFSPGFDTDLSKIPVQLNSSGLEVFRLDRFGLDVFELNRLGLITCERWDLCWSATLPWTIAG